MMGFGSINVYWYFPPVVAAISLVYATSRYESWGRIWWHAARYFALMLGVLTASIVLLLLINP